MYTCNLLHDVSQWMMQKCLLLTSLPSSVCKWKILLTPRHFDIRDLTILSFKYFVRMDRQKSTLYWTSGAGRAHSPSATLHRLQKSKMAARGPQKWSKKSFYEKRSRLRKKEKQAGAELCQAQGSLKLVRLWLTSGFANFAHESNFVALRLFL